MEAIVLAGGLGTRLRAVVPDVPKPMAPVNGRPFLERLLDYWIAQGVSRFILSTGYRHEVLAAHFGATFHGAAIRQVVEDRPLGTGGGLLLASVALTAAGPFLVLNGDTFFEVALKTLRDFHAARSAEVTLCLFRSPQQGRYAGIELGKDGAVRTFGSGEKGGLANGGVYFVERSFLDGGPWQPRSALSLEEDILPFALEAGKRVYGMECSGRFLDIGVPEDYARAAAVLAGEP